MYPYPVRLCKTNGRTDICFVTSIRVLVGWLVGWLVERSRARLVGFRVIAVSLSVCGLSAWSLTKSHFLNSPLPFRNPLPSTPPRFALHKPNPLVCPAKQCEERLYANGNRRGCVREGGERGQMRDPSSPSPTSASRRGATLGVNGRDMWRNEYIQS